MKKTLPALPLVFAACFAAVAQAEPTDLGGGFSLSGNAAIVSDYRFRGYSQTDFRPAAQLGIDLTHSSGFYLGNWNSNVSSFVYTDGNLEMDFYGGWKGDVGGGLTLDAGCCTTTTGVQLAQGRQLQQHRSLPGRDLRQLHAEVLPTRPATSSARPTARAPGTWTAPPISTWATAGAWSGTWAIKLKNQTNMNGDSISHYVD